MRECLSCLGIETCHYFEVVLLGYVEHIGGITLEDVLQGVLTGLLHHVVPQTIKVGVAGERRTGKHIVGVNGAAVKLAGIVGERERVVEVNGEILHRRYLRAQVGANVGGCGVFAVAVLDVGNGRTEGLALISGIRIPTRPTQKVEPSIVLARRETIRLVVLGSGEEYVGTNLPPVANARRDAAVQRIAVVLVAIVFHYARLVKVAKTDVIGGFLAAARHREVVVLLWSPFSGELFDGIERAIEVSVAANNFEVAALLHLSEFFLRHSTVFVFPFFEFLY